MSLNKQIKIKQVTKKNPFQYLMIFPAIYYWKEGNVQFCVNFKLITNLKNILLEYT